MLTEENRVHIDQLSDAELATQYEALQQQYSALRALNLSLDLTRGKPSAEQLALSDALDGILEGNYQAADGTDARNYGVLAGLDEARTLFGAILGTPAEETMIGGNASLSLMYTIIDFALTVGLRGPESAWGNNDVVKFLCPSPGYDRHFSICEHLGIEMISVPMLDTGPDMDAVEALVRQDHTIVGMWCVPRFSNPTGCVYDDETVKRIARLGQISAPHFVVMWDNAYAIHSHSDDAPALASIRQYCVEFGTMDNVIQFGSTSKVTFAGAGISFMASSVENMSALSAHFAIQTIGPDKTNQLRHVRFLPDQSAIAAHMKAHAALVAPRFQSVLETLERDLKGTGMGTWTTPKGGYFISFNTLPNLAREVINMAAEIGVKLTPAGAPFPYGQDPEDSNIRLAPTYPSLEDVKATAEAFTVCVRLASMRQRMEQRGAK